MQSEQRINQSIPHLTIGQQDRTEDLNKRINNRLIPDSDLQPNYDLRPMHTKRMVYPSKVFKEQNNTLLDDHLAFLPQQTFNPGNTKSHVSGFMSNVNVESSLKNIGTPNTKYGSDIYIPSSSSDLYKTTVQLVPGSGSHDPLSQDHGLLFRKFGFESKEKFHPNIGNDMFFNHSRTQLRNQES
jgi:hypothetical protein